MQKCVDNTKLHNIRQDMYMNCEWMYFDVSPQNGQIVFSFFIYMNKAF